MHKVLVSVIVVIGGSMPLGWSAPPDVYVVDPLGSKRQISVVPREPLEQLTVDVVAYLYLPDYESYSPLEGVRVFVAPFDDRHRDDYSGLETSTNGSVRITVQPYEPVNLLFQFDEALQIRSDTEIASSTEVDHLMPLSTFLAGRPGQTMSVHVAMMTVRGRYGKIWPGRILEAISSCEARGWLTARGVVRRMAGRCVDLLGKEPGRANTQTHGEVWKSARIGLRRFES